MEQLVKILIQLCFVEDKDRLLHVNLALQIIHSAHKVIQYIQKILLQVAILQNVLKLNLIVQKGKLLMQLHICVLDVSQKILILLILMDMDLHKKQILLVVIIMMKIRDIAIFIKQIHQQFVCNANNL